MPFPAGHENWIEQQSKQDSYNYLIQRFHLQLIVQIQLTWNISGAISEERRLYLVRRQRYIETVMRDTSNAGMQ